MEKIKPEALLFDMGGVVLGVSFDQVFRHWKRLTTLDCLQMKARFSMDEAYEKHEKGLINAHEYFIHLRSVLELTGTDADIAEGWNAIFGSEIIETFNAIDSVRNKLPIYGFTNTNQAHQNYWEEHFPRVRQTFKQLFVSSEIGLRKPDAEAFHFVLDAISVQPEELLFFDDSEENIEGANQLGIQTVLVTDPASVKAALQQFL